MAKRALCKISAVLILLLLPACAAIFGPKDPFEGLPQSRFNWAIELRRDGKDSLPLVAALITPTEFDGRTRLLVLTTFDAELGDCLFIGGQAQKCRNIDGGNVLVDPIAKAVGDILTQDAVLLFSGGADKRLTLAGEDWKAAGKANGEIVYQPNNATWSLSFKRIP